jgi:hypothetical protein
MVVIGALSWGMGRAGSFVRASFGCDGLSGACFAPDADVADDAADSAEGAGGAGACIGAGVATDAAGTCAAPDATGVAGDTDGGGVLGASVIARSTDRSSFGIRETTTTDSAATVANARPGPNQLDFSHDRQPDSAGFAGRRVTASRASARMRASLAADGCSVCAACAWYSAARRASAGSDEGS